MDIFIRKPFQQTITFSSVERMTSNKLYSIISKVMDVPESEINDQSNSETINSWDSMNVYILINDIETKFNIKFDLDEILQIKNVGDVKNLLIKHGCELND